MGTVEFDSRRFESFIRKPNPPQPLVMINLLRYREVADYPAEFDAAPCSGREAYKRYSEHVIGLIEAAGGRVVWMGRVFASAIAPEPEEWDEAILVEYPSREAFTKMTSSPDYLAILPHRNAALVDSRLIATEPRNGFGRHA